MELTRAACHELLRSVDRDSVVQMVVADTRWCELGEYHTTTILWLLFLFSVPQLCLAFRSPTKTMGLYCPPPCRPCVQATRATPQPRWHHSFNPPAASLHDACMLASMPPPTGGHTSRVQVHYSLLIPPPPQTLLDRSSTQQLRWPRLLRLFHLSCFGRGFFSTPGGVWWRRSSERLRERCALLAVFLPNTHGCCNNRSSNVRLLDSSETYTNDNPCVIASSFEFASSRSPPATGQ